MSLLITDGSEPLTTADVKAWAKIENSDEDTLVNSLITSCRHEIESYTKMVLCNQTWRTFYQFDYAKTIFYSPRMTATSVSVDVDGTTLTVDTDYLFNSNTGRLKLKNEYGSDSEITITWTVQTTLSAQSALKQALLDLVTYRFYNRGTSDMPNLVREVINKYRVFNV